MFDFGRDFMQTMNMPQSYAPMMTMPEQQLESMYPGTYHIIQPVVEDACDKMHSQQGKMHTPNNAELESMIDDVCSKVEADVEDTLNNNSMEYQRQFGFGGRRLLRDLAGILILRNLIDRRNPYYYPGYYSAYPGFYGTYPGYYGGYPGYWQY
jgi:hypothetical protein